MPTQQVEYKTIKLTNAGIGELDDQLEQYTADGWRVKDPLTIRGNTAGFLLEREVD